MPSCRWTFWRSTCPVTGHAPHEGACLVQHGAHSWHRNRAAIGSDEQLPHCKVLLARAVESAFVPSVGVQQVHLPQAATLVVGPLISAQKVFVPRRMPHRQWWPSCQVARSGLDTEAGIKVQCSSTDTSSTIDRTTSSAIQEAAPSAYTSVQPDDENLTWQEVLVQKLLPQCSMSASKQTPAPSPQTSSIASSAMSILLSGKHDPKAVSSQGWQYAGIFLDPLSTARLLAWAPPRHTRLQGDRMTLLVKPSPEQLSSLDLGSKVSLSVLARTENAAIQVVAVQCPQWANQLLQRPAHITISTAEGVKDNSAGDLLRKVEKGHIYGVQTSTCTDNITLTGRVGVKLLNGRVAYSAAELTSDPTTDKCSDLQSVSAPHDHQPVLFLGSPPFPRALPSHMPATGLTSLRPTPSGLHQAHSSFQAYTADMDVIQARNAASTLLQPQPAVQQALDEDLNDDDAFDAICDLDALLTPPSLHQPAPASSHDSGDSTEQYKRQCNPQTRPSSVRAHTSTAHRGSPQHGQYLQTQTYSPKKGDVRAQGFSSKKADVRAQVYSPKKGDGRCSAASRSSGRCLWTGDQQTAAEAAPVSAAMRILKRPVIPDQQASCSAVSPPLAATINLQKGSVSRLSAANAGSQATPYSTVGAGDSPVSGTSSNESPTSVSGLNYSQGQQSMQRSTAQQIAHSNDRSISKAPSVAPAAPSNEAVSTDTALCTGLSASKLDTACAFPPGLQPNNSTACAFPPGLQPREAYARHDSSPVHQLVMELQEQPLLAEASGNEPVSQNSQGGTDKAVAFPQQHRLLAELSQETDTAASCMMSRQHISSHAPQAAAVPRQPTPIDVERSGAAEQITTGSSLLLDHSSGSPPHSSQPVLLPAGVTAASPPQLSSEGTVAQSPRPYASVDEHMPSSSLQQTTNAGSLGSGSDSRYPSQPERPGVTVPHQLDFLRTDDPVATAIAEANKVVADRAGLMSLADQRREALNLHVQAKDTYFAAAQTAHEKGDRDAALQLAAKGKEHAQLAKEARQAANQAAFQSFNLHVTNRFKVDLHGLHVEEALQVLEQHLLTLGGLGCPGGVLLQVITGVGKHSINGRPKILPAVVRYLSDAGYRFTETLGNSGVLEVIIGGHRRLLDG